MEIDQEASTSSSQERGSENPTPAKRPRLNIDTEMKTKCLQFIIDVYEAIRRNMLTAGAFKEYDISAGQQIMSCIVTENHKRRSIANGTLNSNVVDKSANKPYSISVTYSSITTLESETVTTIFDDQLRRHGLQYTRDITGHSWIGTLSHYLNFLSGFPYRIKELRTGCMRIPMGTDASGAMTYQDAATYGIDGDTQILLSGITMPPERRSSMVQSLGPMAQLVCLLNSRGAYVNRYRTAVLRSMSYIPYIRKIIERIEANYHNGTHRPLCQLLAEICVLATTRHSNRCFIPIEMLYIAYISNITTAQRKSFFEHVNFSGAGAYDVYMRCSKKEGWLLHGSYSQKQAAEAIFHAYFGTMFADLGLLEWMTGHNFENRESFGDAFKKGNNIAGTKLIPIKYWSKFSSANQSGIFSGVYSQNIGDVIFSGQQDRIITQDFFNKVFKRGTEDAPIMTERYFIKILQEERDKILAEIRDKNGMPQRLDTTTWYPISECSKKEAEARNPINVVAASNGRFFFGP